MFSFSGIGVCVGGRETSSYVGPERSIGAEGVWFFFLCCTLNPVSIPHVYTVAMTTSRVMAPPTTAAVFRVSRAPRGVAIESAK